MPNGGSGGGGGTPSGGYSIPISGSQSAAQSQQLAAGTVFNFYSPGASGDWYDQSATPVSRAESTAASAPGGTATAATGGGAIDLPGGFQVDTKTMLIVAGVALVAIIGAIWLARKAN